MTLGKKYTQDHASRQGNYSKEQEIIWEKEKLEGLAKWINKNPALGREFLKKLEFKKSKDYVQKIKDAANNEREKLIKARKNRQFNR